ncbi:uncharacterized protein BYT42DRAFT_567003 [Radiomyces spectabilis]|uniref:uncharacterized protein n=1 Tax=Radiomyces spectabilis TaxID=64574 RepID=UPI00221EFC93|nr:uncharacterized protein BYT42DRAFT_567003 [Radiomyces spectabilis]KAI8381573.1 hypothetical protein BYT42DRAFT_567003 [Radiomyces spectabilis]
MNLLDQVTDQLATIELKDDDISEYIAGIVQEDSLEDDEKREAISEFLAETTDKPTGPVINTILEKWKVIQQDLEKAEADRKAKLIEEAQAREKARQAQLEQEAASRRETAKKLTEEERQRRQRLMRQYDRDDDSETVVTNSNDALLQANLNAEKIKQQEQSRRDQMKKQSEEEKERNKMLLKKQREEKEKEREKNKKGTPKKERRRM